MKKEKENEDGKKMMMMINEKIKTKKYKIKQKFEKRGVEETFFLKKKMNKKRIGCERPVGERKGVNEKTKNGCV